MGDFEYGTQEYFEAKRQSCIKSLLTPGLPDRERTRCLRLVAQYNDKLGNTDPTLDNAMTVPASFSRLPKNAMKGPLS